MQLLPSAADVRRMIIQAASSRRDDDILRAGALALQTGVQADALLPVQQAALRSRGNARLWQLLGLLNRDLDDLPASVAAFAKAAELLPGDPLISNGYACVALEAGLPAVELFERAIRADPRDRDLRLRLIAARIDAGDVAEAIEELETTVARYPDWSNAHRKLAGLRWARGDREHFTDSFERALARAPRDAKLWQAYADLMVQDQLQDRALDVVSRARSFVGLLPGLDAVEVVARAELHQMDRAAAMFPQALQTGRLDVIVAFLRFLLRSGRPQEVASIAENNLAEAGAHLWPYLSIAWRLTGDPRWEWLEGDSRFIGIYDIAEELPHLGELAERLRTVHRASDAPFDQSVRGGTQTDGDLMPPLRKEFADLRQTLIAAIERHVAQLPAPHPQHPLLVERRSPINFSGSWSVLLRGGGHHVEHFHPAGWISSALYVSLPSEQERGAGEAGWLSLGEPCDLVPGLSPLRLVEPKPGRLVLFPSTMWHGTRSFGAGERLTVAFDVKRPRQSVA